MKNLSELKTLLETPKKLVIIPHHKPDGDAIGSSLGLYHYLIQKGHSIDIISPNSFADFLKWMPSNEIIIDFEVEEEKTKELIAHADLIFCLDFNTLKRINEMGELVAQSAAIKVMIDHHQQPDDFADFILSETTASSTCQLVYDFMEMNKDLSLLNKSVAISLYTGMVTDTGSFRFSSVSPRVHQIAAHLLEFKINHEAIHEQVSGGFSENRMKFFGYCISNKLQVIPEYNTALISVTSQELKEYNIQTGDTEGLVNYPRSIKGNKLAALIIDREEMVKLSLRSVGDVDVNHIARTYFEGGGHKNAAGGKSEHTLEETVQKFISILPSFKEILK